MGHLLIGIGVAATIAGIVTILYCIAEVRRVRRLGDDAALRQRMQRVVTWNLGALAASTLGLMLVVLGLFLRG